MPNDVKNKTEKFKIKYSIGTNFDKNLISEITKYNSDGIFTSVFGKLRSDVIGGGRASMILPDISFEELKNYISDCHENKLKFNYLMNPACTGNRDMEVRSHRQIIEFVKKLSEIGVDAITVNSPYLCEVIKKQFLDIKISIGLYAAIYNINHVKYWTELGADELTLAHSLTRNFEALENMLTYTKGHNVSLRLIANNVCLQWCPYDRAHGNANSHSSQEGDLAINSQIDYCAFKCTAEKVKNPVALVSAEYIRPEDIKYYEELCERTGNYNFSIKLVDRIKTTEFLAKVIKAYATRSFEGNLLDILSWPRPDSILQIHKESIEEIPFEEQFNFEEIKKYFGVLNLPDVILDNKKLDGFVDKFTTKYECDKKICENTYIDGRKSLNEGNSKLVCSYCKNWAQKAISYNEGEVKNWSNNFDHVLAGFRESKLFSRPELKQQN